MNSSEIIKAGEKVFGIVRRFQVEQSTIISGVNVYSEYRPMQFKTCIEVFGAGYVAKAEHARLQETLLNAVRSEWVALLGMHNELSQPVESGKPGDKFFNYGYLSQCQAGRGLHQLSVRRSQVEVCGIGRQFYEVVFVYGDDWLLTLRAERRGEGWDEWMVIESV